MTRKEFRHLVKSKYLILDGATGSNLQKKGMPTGVCPEEWILEHPQAIISLQREFADAGSDIVYAPTFTGNRIKLAEYGLENRLEEINTKLVGLSREAVGGRALVAGDITMTGRQLVPMGNMDFEQLVDIYAEQIRVLDAAGADLLIIETMMSLNETRAALIAAKECSDLPVMATLTFEADGRTLFGTDPETAAVVLSSLGADAVGANCSTGPDQMAAIIKKMREASSVPVIAKPNAGLPRLDENGRTVYDLDEASFAAQATLLLDAGASIIGGCCGSTPGHIRELARIVGQYEDKRSEFRDRYGEGYLFAPGRRFLCSERKTVGFGLDDRFMIVGERINPTGKKKLQAQIREGDFSMVETFAIQQQEKGASVLDINMGMSGINEKETLIKVMEIVTELSDLPLCVDSTDPEVVEAVLRRYPGRALINSVSLEKDRIERMLPLAVKYGAMFILLPVSDEGLPADIEEKKKIINEILDKAFALGLHKEDVVADGLVGTIGANPFAAREVLDTIEYCRKMGIATICGLSNISFGLPERSYVNSAFLTMAIQRGLTMAIANPNQELLTGAWYASDLLMAREGADIAYIEEMNRRAAQKPVIIQTAAAPSALPPDAGKKDLCDDPVLSQIAGCVTGGRRAKVVDLTRDACDNGYAPARILDEALLPAINEVGRLFDEGRYFLPQLIAGAETMKLAIEYLEPFLLEGREGREKGCVVIATVEGDIHDIGKNLVALMLKNYGFRVIDLGKDVPAAVIVDTAMREKAQIIGLSALMTTTMQQMDNVVKYAKEKGCSSRIMIGGAVITPDYAEKIGADAYSSDASDAVRVAEELLREFYG